MKKTLLDWLSYMQSIHVSAIDMGLSRVLPVAEKLGLITAAKNSYVFTVAGTNGKGSTTAVIAEVCQQAGLKTALYQSPHLLEFNERVKINGLPASDDRLIHAFEQVEQARLDCGLSLSFFEMTTLAAFLIFAQSDCDVWVLEIGLGGRLDVVNIIDPNMTVITNVGIDHIDWLGSDRENIGYEKAGILRTGVPLIYGETDMPASVQKRIDELGVDCYQLGQDFSYHSQDLRENEAQDKNTKQHSKTWQYSNSASTFNLPLPTLSLINASNAISALLASQLTITADAISKGLEQVKLIGRFDYRQLAKRQWLFDVAHNEAGVNFLLSQLSSRFPSVLKPDGQASIKVVFSMLKDKDIANVVQLLHTGLNQSVHSEFSTDKQFTTPLHIQWYVAPIDATHNPRSADINQLTTAIEQHVNPQVIHTFTNLQQATQTVINQSSEEDLILVCGSFHTIAECLQELTQ